GGALGGVPTGPQAEIRRSGGGPRRSPQNLLAVVSWSEDQRRRRDLDGVFDSPQIIGWRILPAVKIVRGQIPFANAVAVSRAVLRRLELIGRSFRPFDTVRKLRQVQPTRRRPEQP